MVTHRDYVIDRNTKIDRMFRELTDKGGKIVDDFRDDPAKYAAQYGLELSEEEIFTARSLARGNTGLTDLWEQFRTSRLAFFDNNCGCGGGGGHSHVV
jgi:hypothetical protein